MEGKKRNSFMKMGTDSFSNLLGEIRESSKVTFTASFLIVIAVLHIFTFVAMPAYLGRTEPIHGYVHERFASVARLFQKNFMDGFERDGANFAVFHRNKAVVNIWAGYSDSRLGKRWTSQTRSVLFSATKPLSGLCIALLVDRGHLNYDDRVSKYWPEFGQNGKENTTVRQVLGHEAGLPYIEEVIDFEDAEGNATGVLRKLAAAKPLWKPGTGTGYHPVTYGWLVDGIVRGADPYGRSLQRFFNEEIAEKFNLDISIGSDSEDTHRIAHLTHPGILEIVRDIIIDPRLIIMYLMSSLQPSEAIIHQVFKNPKFIDFNQEIFPFNNPRVQTLSIGSATGIANAYDFAKLFALTIDGQIISSHTIDEISRPSVESWHIEKTVIYPLMKGHGFFYDYHPEQSGSTTRYTFGHPGYGCQALHVDPLNELVIVYLANGLKSATSYLCLPYQRLIAETYRALR
ncbi:hypothetical protein FO519_005286 [Halicephalobus sp. NKZ332]|nr:hypothetical protein FO519_005286 [Halicephalobus sp. NKZ332]